MRKILLVAAIAIWACSPNSSEEPQDARLQAIAEHLATSTDSVTINYTDTVYIPISVLQHIGFNATFDTRDIIRDFNTASQNPQKAVYKELIARGDSIYNQWADRFREATRLCDVPQKVSTDTPNAPLDIFEKMSVTHHGKTFTLYKNVEDSVITDPSIKANQAAKECYEALIQMSSYLDKRREFYWKLR